jgi:hypothetical protein
MSEDNWYDQPIDDDWSDVSNLEGYDEGGNWTGMNSSGNSIFQDTPIMDNWNSWNNGGGTNDFELGGSVSSPGMPDHSFLDQFNPQPSMSGPMSMPGAGAMGMTQPLPQEQGGTQDFLGRLFSNPTLMAKGIGALFEGSQNKQRARDLSGIAQKAGFDPFGSQRPFYQQQLQQAVQNPYQAPIVANQVNQMAQTQAIKDAAAGRRSSSLASSPGVLAAQAKVAQDYINSLYTPAGANIRPDAGGLASILDKGSQANTNGWISPLLSVLGNATRGNETGVDSRQAAIDAIMKLYQKG